MSLSTVQKYVMWKGKKSNYRNWKRKFDLNCANKNMETGFELDEKDFPKATAKDFDMDKKKFLDENNKSFKELIFSIDHETKEGAIAIAHATNSKTKNLPKGSARKAIENLELRYNTRDTEDMREMQDKYEAEKMGRKNPAYFVNDMEVFRIELETDFNIKK